MLTTQIDMKIVTLYSPSHKNMLESYFLSSFPKDERIELKIVEAPQLAGDKPTFNDPNWKSFMHIKAKLLLDELLAIPENDVYGFIDVDIINVNNFYDYVVEQMQDFDMICQSDSPYPNILNACTGIIFFRNNEVCRNLLKATHTYLDKFNNEQESLTYFVANSKSYHELMTLKYKLLPFDRAFTYGALGKGVWQDENDVFNIPPKESLLWLHANYCHYENKEKLLEMFQTKLK